MSVNTDLDVEKVLDDYQHETGDESLLKYMGLDLFVPKNAVVDETAVHHDMTDQVGDGYDFKWSDYIITQENGGIMNNLNFDNDSAFGLGISAYNINLDTTNRSSNTTTFSLYDPNDFNPVPATRATALDATNSSVDPVALAKTLYFYPIKISGIIYRVIDSTGTGGDPLVQLNDGAFEFSRANIDGSILRKGDIQPNYRRRNWWFQDDLAVLTGDLVVTSDTQQIIEVFGNNIIELTYLVDRVGG
tara:strand:+ start:737 stop:1474 length:738 start_codon:yes stop_codon:yes gene_type:complete